MDFERKKLSLSEINTLIEIDVGDLVPLRPLGTVVYLCLAQNQKLVAIKGPFDFFTNEEIDRIRGAGKVYAHPILESVDRIRRVAERVRAVLAWQEPAEGVFLEPAPYEISYSLKPHLSAVWRRNEQALALETFFLPFFIESLCGALPPEELLRFRNEDFMTFEDALLCTATTLFLAINCGYLDVKYLTDAREKLFLEFVSGARADVSVELRELFEWVRGRLRDDSVTRLYQEDFESGTQVTTSKVFSKLEKLDRPILDVNEESVYGPNGLIGVDAGKETDVRVA